MLTFDLHLHMRHLHGRNPFAPRDAKESALERFQRLEGRRLPRRTVHPASHRRPNGASAS